MKVLLSIFSALVVFSASAQINPPDSSVQVIGYWSKQDKQTYRISDSKFKVQGEDTTSVETIRYEVDITVLDSTENSYIVEWHYKNFDVAGSNNFTKSIASIFKDIKVVIKTTEMGAFQEVVNWKEVQGEMKKAFGVIRKQFKTSPNIETLLANVEAQMSSKESIESAAIEDVLQFYTFHGGKYVLNSDVEEQLVSNGIPEVPVNVLMTVRLAEINVEEDNAVLRYWKEFDPKQMTDASYEMMRKLVKSSGEKLPLRSEMPEIRYEENVGCRIHGSTGWVIYSVLTKQTATGDAASVEQREIEIL